MREQNFKNPMQRKLKLKSVFLIIIKLDSQS